MIVEIGESQPWFVAELENTLEFEKNLMNIDQPSLPALSFTPYGFFAWAFSQKVGKLIYYFWKLKPKFPFGDYR